MSTRWVVIVVVSVFIAVFIAALALTGDEDGGPASVPATTPSASASPAVSPSATLSPSSTSSVSPTPSPTASTAPAASFSATGDLISEWYWLRDAAHLDAAMWEFDALPGTGDVTFVVEVLATDTVDGARGQRARFFFSWRSTTAGWAGRLPVTLPNVSPADDPLGYICRGAITIPRSTIGDTPTLTVRIGREDVRGELPPSDVHVAVNASSVTLRLP
jgi:hypothetical protein